MVRSKNTKAEDESSSAFAKHADQDDALRHDEMSATKESNEASNGLSISGRIMVFIVFPITCGTIGLYMGYLESLRRAERKISFDQDFVIPFLLAVAMAVVLFFQTAGFSSNKVKPVVAWPKVRRVKKIVKKKKGEAESDKVDHKAFYNKKED